MYTYAIGMQIHRHYREREKKQKAGTEDSRIVDYISR